ncbi:MAG: HNH endonuclease, partial [Gemmatimonadetes bacterium]|nr:HNH endonuclease [Gemmatimonadota bacterium]
AASDSNHSYWMELPEAKAFIRELNLFRVRQAMPLLFAAWESFSSEDFVRILKLVSVISFRYTVISRLNTNDLEPVYHNAAKAVSDGEAASPAEVFERLEQIYVDDEKMHQDFALFAVPTRGPRKKLAKYILARLEADVANRYCDPDTDPGTIEHILPENPTEAWSETFAPERWEVSMYRLGNLTLLEAATNRTVGNAAYADKCAAYNKSSYVLTKKIPEIAPEQWTPELVDERQRQLAARAVHLWRSDFA